MGTNPKRTLDIFYAQGGSGLFIGPVREWHDLDLSRFSLVKLSRANSPYATATVDHAPFEETMEAFTQMRRRGCRAILPAIRQHTPRVSDDLLRRGAILACQQDLRSDERAIPPLEIGHADDRGFIAAVRKYRPDAVLGFSIGDYFTLKDAGFRIPENLGFAALHLGTGRTAGVEIAGIEEDENSFMRNAFQLMGSLLSSELRGNEAGRSFTAVPYPWINGSSIR